MAASTTDDLGAVKRALHEFAASLAAAPAARRNRAARDFGELFLTLLRLADQLDIDLIQAAEDVVEQKAARRPTLHKPRASR